MDNIKEKNYVAGFKQSRKAIEKGCAELVYIAKDADMHVACPIEHLCKEKTVEIEYVNSMKELAHGAGVEVPTAVVTIVKNA